MWGGHFCPPAFDFDLRLEKPKPKTRPRAAGKSARSTFSRKGTEFGAKSLLFHVLSCESWAAMVASIPNVASLGLTQSRAMARRGSFRRAASRAGEAETGRRTGAKEFKSRRAKRLGWRLRERLSLQAPHRRLRLRGSRGTMQVQGSTWF